MIEPMRGWQITRTGAPGEVLHLAELPVPEPGPGQLTVDVQYAGLSFADILLIRGEYQVSLPLPCVPGSEFVGRVRACGPETGIPVGTRVIGLCVWPDGPYAQVTVVHEDHCEPIPDSLAGPEAVSLIGNYVTAHLALHRRARVQPGDVVVVHGGAGGVGVAGIQVAKAAGATVIAADLGAERAQACLDAGADHAVDVTDPAALTHAVRTLTGGHGADVVLDMVGGDLFDAARRFVAYEGRIVVVGFTSGTIPQVRVNQLLLRSFAVVGMNALTVLNEHPEVHRQARKAVVELLASGAVAPPVAAVRAMEDLVDLAEAFIDRKLTGKAVVHVGPSREE